MMRHWMIRVLLAVSDLAMVALALVAGALVAKMISPHWADLSFLSFAWPNLPARLSVVAPLALAMTGYFALHGHYSRRMPWWHQVLAVAGVVGVLLVLDGFFSYLTKTQFSRIWLLATWASAVPLILLGRLLIRALAMKLNLWATPTVIVGSGSALSDTLHALHSDRFEVYDVRMVVCLGGEADMPDLPKRYAHVPVACQMPDMEPYFGLQTGWLLVMCPSRWGDPTLLKLMDEAKSLPHAELAVIPPVGGISLYAMEARTFFGHDVVMMVRRAGVENPLNRLLKRGLDIVGSLGGLFVFGIPILVLAWVIQKDGGPAFYSQQRVGLGGKMFACWKLRSMVPNAKEVLEKLLAENPEARAEWEQDFKLKDDPRITRLGRVIRKYSIDELPQLWNVLKGDMSLVGPRPIVPDELAYYGSKAMDYKAVKPGLTGLWQVSGRNDTSYATRVRLDSWYVDNWSLWHDIVIILKTIRTVLAREGAY